MTKLIFPILALLCLVACEKNEVSEPQTINTQTELTAVLQQIYEESEAPGFALSIVKEDSLLYQHAFGYADTEAGIPYTNQTVQPLGSVSKTFVAAALVRAIDLGYFTLDTDINELLPFSVQNPHFPDAAIQVRDLVTHTSGLLDDFEYYVQRYYVFPGEDVTGSGAQILLNDFGLSQRQEVPLATFLSAYYGLGGADYAVSHFAQAEPGTQWTYSNLATSLTALLIESATQQDFSTFVQMHVLQPLQMAQSTYEKQDVPESQLAQLYWASGIPLPQYGNDSYPDGSLHSSNADMARYLQNMMLGAKGETEILFSKDQYAMLFDPLLEPGMLPFGFGDNHGVFWFLDGDIITHDGSDPGLVSHLQFDRSGETGFVLLANMDVTQEDQEAVWNTFFNKVKQAVEAFLEAN